jgi:hypothetical protein
MKIKTVFAVVTLSFFAFSGCAQITQKVDAQDAAVESAYRPSSNSRLSVWRDESTDGALLFLGTHHTFDVNDAQIKDIERMFKSFRPTLVALEGGTWSVASSRNEAVAKYGEMGLARYHASMNGIPTTDVDAPFKDEIAELLKSVDTSTLKTFYAIRQLPQILRESSSKSVDARISEFLSMELPTTSSALKSSPNSSEDLRSVLATHAAKFTDWREIDPWNTSALTPSLLSKEPFQSVLRKSNEYRNQQMTLRIKAARKQNQRLLVITGVSHLAAIMPKL